MSDQANAPEPKGPPRLRGPWIWIAVLMLVPTVAYFFYLRSATPPATHAVYDIPYSRLKALIAANAVSELRLRGEEATGALHTAAPLGPNGKLSKYFRTYLPSFGDPTLLPALERHQVRLDVIPATASDGLTLLLAWLPWIFFIGLIWWAMRRGSRNLVGGLGGGGELRKFLEPFEKASKIPSVRFADVAGQDNAKQEIQELVEYLRNPAKFTKLGAEMPRGVLLVGPPGTGKTMLAKALAGEAGVPFYSISGSEFIEVFVGVGASRVRNLFTAAKRDAPAIIFVDELDSIGRTRGTGLGGGHDEREQTLNQILKEMDGFDIHEAVIVLAATNRPDVLDPALLRPGRFDRHVTLELPDRRDREAVLAVHAHKIPLEQGVDLARIAAITPSFSGADLKNLINEAAILAARDGRSLVAMRDFAEARDRVILGATRQLLIEPDERHRLAVHEAGHAVVAHFLPKADPLYKVSIIPRGRALGGTQQLQEQERYTLPEDYLKDRLAVILGGRTAERALLVTVSSGADDDIRQASALARAMVARWGMSEAIGPVDLREAEEHPFLGREIALPRHFSENSAEAVDKAVHALLREAEGRAAEVIRAHRDRLDALITVLEKEDSLESDQIEACLGPTARTAEHAAVAHL